MYSVFIYDPRDPTQPDIDRDFDFVHLAGQWAGEELARLPGGWAEIVNVDEIDDARDAENPSGMTRRELVIFETTQAEARAGALRRAQGEDAA